MNTEFQRRARRDKKAFQDEQYREIEQTIKMGKTSGLSKKIRDTKGTFHAKVGTIKDRNKQKRAETEAEDIKKKWQEYTELHKKDLHDTDNQAGVITNLEPDNLECKVNLGTQEVSLQTKLVEVREFQLSCFKS